MRSELFDSFGRLKSWIGALALHFLVFVMVLMVSFNPPVPTPIEIVSIELVQLRSDALVKPSDVVEPTEIEPNAPIKFQDAHQQINPFANSEQNAPPLPSPQTTTVVAPLSIRSSEPESESGIEPIDEDETDDEFGSKYIIRPDPFLELPPSASARIAASVICARTNRETRPAFCPDTDDEDTGFAQTARTQGDFGGYRPRDEIIFSDGLSFDEYASRKGYETFRNRQARYNALGGGENPACLKGQAGIPGPRAGGAGEPVFCE